MRIYANLIIVLLVALALAATACAHRLPTHRFKDSRDYCNAIDCGPNPN